MRRDRQPEKFSKKDEASANPKKPLAADLARDDNVDLKNEEGVSYAKQGRKKRGIPPAGRRPLFTIRSTPPRKNDWLWWVGGFLVAFVIGLAVSLAYGWILDPRPAPVTPDKARKLVEAERSVRWSDVCLRPSGQRENRGKLLSYGVVRLGWGLDLVNGERPVAVAVGQPEQPLDVLPPDVHKRSAVDHQVQPNHDRPIVPQEQQVLIRRCIDTDR